jgi:hypothetical protein
MYYTLSWPNQPYTSTWRRLREALSNGKNLKFCLFGGKGRTDGMPFFMFLPLS